MEVMRPPLSAVCEAGISNPVLKLVHYIRDGEQTHKPQNSQDKATAQVVTHILPEFDSHWWGPHASLQLSMRN